MNNDVYIKILAEFKHLVNILKVSDFLDTNEKFGFNGKLLQFSIALPNYKIRNHQIYSEYAFNLQQSYYKRFNGG